MPDWTCPRCAVQNADAVPACELCGTLRARPTPSGPPVLGPRACTGCGAPRRADGGCARGGGFDGNLRHPPGDGCPTCRDPLAWSGACYGCHTVPGDGWAWQDGHFVLDREGPGRRATLDESRAALTAIGLRMEAAEAQGHFVTRGDPQPVGALLFHGLLQGLRSAVEAPP